jgi:hypothetical protein
MQISSSNTSPVLLSFADTNMQHTALFEKHYELQFVPTIANLK